MGVFAHLFGVSRRKPEPSPADTATGTTIIHRTGHAINRTSVRFMETLCRAGPGGPYLSRRVCFTQ